MLRFAVLAALFSLVVCACQKSPTSRSAAPVPAPAQTSANVSGGASSASGTSVSTPAAPSGAQGTSADEDSEDSDEGPVIEDSREGAPAMMSEDAFLAAYRDVDGVIARPDGLMYRVLASGHGASPKPGDKVRVSYVGTLMDNSVFDATPKGETRDLPVDGRFPGWREALLLMHEGDKWEIVIPSDLAFGAAGAEGIAPNMPLIYELELVKVLPAG